VLASGDDLVKDVVLNAIEYTIEEMCTQFRAHPTLFYTEDDVVSFFYDILQENLPVVRWPDKDGCEHFLVHRGYPTPFRYDTSGTTFEMKGEKGATKRARYQRGAHDIVVLNPEFLANFSCDVLKAHDHAKFTEQVMNRYDGDFFVILCGIELLFTPEPLSFSKGRNREKEIDQFVGRVTYDADKLVASQQLKEFMQDIRVLVYVKGARGDVSTLVSQKLSARPEVRLCVAE